MKKKSIGPIVAMSLLITVAVLGTVGFQSFFSEYSSKLFADVETQSSDASENSIRIEGIYNNILYIKPKKNLTISAIYIGKTNCDINLTTSKQIEEFDVTVCLAPNNLSSVEIIIYTNNKIFTKKQFFTNQEIIRMVSGTLNFNTLNTTLNFNTSTNLSWTSSVVTSCIGSGDWNGSKGTNGTENTGLLTSNKTYLLNCSGNGWFLNEEINVIVLPKPPINETISTNTQNYNLFSALGSPASPIKVNVYINSGVYVWSDSTSLVAFDTGAMPAGSTINIYNKGFIMGKGGAGRAANTGLPGGNAISISINISINNTDGYIGGGGGGGGGGELAGGPGGGGGAGGGAGGSSSNGGSGGAGGSIGNSGSNGVLASGYYPGGGGGGRIMPGVGGTARCHSAGILSGLGGGAGGSGGMQNNGAGGSICSGAGGSAGGGGGNATSNHIANNAAGGGGGWGAAGGAGKYQSTTRAGGAGGKAVELNGNSVTWIDGLNTSRTFGTIS